jgi:hypothetical protein
VLRDVESLCLHLFQPTQLKKVASSNYLEKNIGTINLFLSYKGLNPICVLSPSTMFLN